MSTVDANSKLNSWNQVQKIITSDSCKHIMVAIGIIGAFTAIFAATGFFAHMGPLNSVGQQYLIASMGVGGVATLLGAVALISLINHLNAKDQPSEPSESQAPPPPPAWFAKIQKWADWTRAF